jgi:two-component system OmpR family response regulator
MKILVVDDDPRLRDLVAIALERAGHLVITAADGQLALTHSAREAPDLIVLDIGLPELDGFEVCRRIRTRSEVPILFLTARDDEIDRILGLELGADDYVTKPFSPRELVARHGAITLDRKAHSCRVGEQEVALTATEFQLLAELLQALGQVRTRAQLIHALWGASSPVSDRTLDCHLRNLRRKLAEAGSPDAVETLHGVGVRLKGGV